MGETFSYAVFSLAEPFTPNHSQTILLFFRGGTRNSYSVLTYYDNF